MIARVLVVVLAAALAFAPLPRGTVERWYSNGLYPRIQTFVTPATNLVPFALLDAAVFAVLAAGTWLLVRRWRRHGGARALARTAVTLVVTAAVVYVAFLAMWGLNYQRVPLEEKVAFEPQRITREAAVRLANEAARGLNAGHHAAHARAFDRDALAAAFAGVQRALGAGQPAAIGVPKPSLAGLYFRAAGFDGMTDPLFLEIILNPDLLPVEQPFVLAHEWAHLAGYAHEAEANFVAWLTCARGDALAAYSGWLSAYSLAAGALPRAARRTLVPLDAGPRADFAAIAARYGRSSPAVREAARNAYDRYLRANRIDEGIENYDAALRLMLGVQLDRQGIPIRRGAGRP